MKLELKHVAGYLPYVLKGVSKEENLGFEEVKGFSIYGKHNTVCLITNIDDIDLELFQPILRPLSDLTKEIEEDVVVYNKLSRRSQSDFAYEEPSVLKWAYDDIQILLEHHFDIHGLIESGLAIDINTLQ